MAKSPNGKIAKSLYLKIAYVRTRPKGRANKYHKILLTFFLYSCPLGQYICCYSRKYFLKQLKTSPEGSTK